MEDLKKLPTEQLTALIISVLKETNTLLTSHNLVDAIQKKFSVSTNIVVTKLDVNKCLNSFLRPTGTVVKVEKNGKPHWCLPDTPYEKDSGPFEEMTIIVCDIGNVHDAYTKISPRLSSTCLMYSFADKETNCNGAKEDGSFVPHYKLFKTKSDIPDAADFEMCWWLSRLTQSPDMCKASYIILSNDKAIANLVYLLKKHCNVNAVLAHSSDQVLEYLD